MPRKKLPYIRVGNIILPRPPYQATDIKLTCADGRFANVKIKDVDTLIGVAGKIQFFRRNNKGKHVETYESCYTWDGYSVVECKDMVVE